jgi:leucyl-tRNA synthetase
MKARPRRRDIVKLQRAAEMRRAPTMAEDDLWQELRGFKPKFTRQFVIEGFIVDLICRKAGLIVEIDGGVHDDNEVADAQRDTILRAAGFRVVRVRNEEVMADPEAVAAYVRSLVAPP